MSLSSGLSLPLRRLHASKPICSVLRTQSPASLSRAFSTTLKRDASWGFIGLGQMGAFHVLSHARGIEPRISYRPSESNVIFQGTAWPRTCGPRFLQQIRWLSVM